MLDCTVQQNKIDDIADSLPLFLGKTDDFIGQRLAELFNTCEMDDFESIVDDIEAHLNDRERFGLCGAECNMSWIHSNGVSVKEMALSPMSVVTGSEHKVETINSVTQGSVMVFTSSGVDYFTAGDVFVSKPGVRKLGVTMNGVRFTNAFPNPLNERNEESLDEMYFEPPVEHPEISEYECFRRIIGLDQETIDKYMEIAGESVGVPCGSIILKESTIDGTGTFADRDIKKGERFSVFTENNRTILARYSNHSFTPNTWLVGSDAIALENIKEGDEITMNYLDNYIKTNGNGGLKCLQQ
jgi:hypothetical protein